MNRMRLAVGVLTIALLAVGLSFGQDKKDTKSTLPAHYKQLNLSAEQTDKIKAVQAEYKDKIADLKAQLKKAEAQEKSECLKVLTDEQKKKLADLTIGESSDEKKEIKKPEPTKDEKK